MSTEIANQKAGTPAVKAPTAANPSNASNASTGAAGSGSVPSKETSASTTEGLSSKDLKALKKAQKAQKRASQKEQIGLPPRTDPREKQAAVQAALNAQNKPVVVKSTGWDRKIPLYAHLDLPVLSTSKLTEAATKEVHSAVFTLALQFASYQITGSSARCKAMMEAFRALISDYSTPKGTTLARNLTAQLGHQIDFLKLARPLSISMGNAIRALKQEISTISIDLSDKQAKDYLLEIIDNFVRDRIDVADQAIVDTAVSNINSGDTVLTYGHSEVVKQTLLAAAKEGKRFSVIVVDSRPLFEGRTVARELANAGIECNYVMISALSYIMTDVTSVMLGAHAMLSNGLLYSRVGTAMVCSSAVSRNVPVTVLCETIKFTDRVQLDAVTFNELAPERALLNISNDPKNSMVESCLGSPTSEEAPQNLYLLNVLYDLTDQSSIKKVITELGSIPASSVPVILREYKSL